MEHKTGRYFLKVHKSLDLFRTPSHYCISHSICPASLAFSQSNSDCPIEAYLFFLILASVWDVTWIWTINLWFLGEIILSYLVCEREVCLSLDLSFWNPMASQGTWKLPASPRFTAASLLFLTQLYLLVVCIANKVVSARPVRKDGPYWINVCRLWLVSLQLSLSNPFM